MIYENKCTNEKKKSEIIVQKHLLTVCFILLSTQVL